MWRRPDSIDGAAPSQAEDVCDFSAVAMRPMEITVAVAVAIVALVILIVWGGDALRGLALALRDSR